MRRLPAVIVLLALLALTMATSAQTNLPPAPLINDEGGAVAVYGAYQPSIPSLRDYGSQPVVFLGDIANVFEPDGFTFSTENLELRSPQILASTTGDIRQEQLRYEIRLPIQPGGQLTDITNSMDDGIMLYSVNFTFNGIGAPIIDDREFITFSSVTYSQDYATLFEINGGRVIVYAPTEGQAFPADYGPDRLLFTADDPLVALPAGYTVVNLSASPFTFDRSQNVNVPILESEGEEFPDFSTLAYTPAFDALAQMMREEYAFTDLKGINWDALIAAHRPQIIEAEQRGDRVAYMRALDAFLQSIPDGHVGSNALDGFINDALNDIGSGVGLSLVESDGGRFWVAQVVPNSPADGAGILRGAEVVAINGRTIPNLIAEQTLWFGPYSSDHNRRLEQLRHVTRAAQGEILKIDYVNPGATEQAASLRAIGEVDSLYYEPFAPQDITQTLPVNFHIMDDGTGYVSILSFSDDNLLTLMLWERAMLTFINAGVNDLVIDMRSNGGGSPDISNVMLGYLFDTPTYIGTSAFYYPDLDRFEFDPLHDQYIEPADYQYRGDVAVMISPTCYSACEFFTYALTLRDGVDVVGYYPTGGLGGGIKQFAMPEGIIGQFTVARAVGATNTIHIEGTGVAPTVTVPRTPENLVGDHDAVLDAAVNAVRR